MDHTADIKKLIQTKKLLIGTNSVLKPLRAGHLAKAYLSSNCPDDVKSDIMHFAKLSKAEIIQLDIPNEELGTICKKPFFVSIVGVKK